MSRMPAVSFRSFRPPAVDPHIFEPDDTSAAHHTPAGSWTTFEPPAVDPAIFEAGVTHGRGPSWSSFAAPAVSPHIFAAGEPGCDEQAPPEDIGYQQ
jgi:hypothetical protein